MIEMRKIDNIWVRPEAIEAVAEYEDGFDPGEAALLTLHSGAQHIVGVPADEVVRILSEDPIRSWGALDEIPRRPQFEGTVPRD